MLNTGKVLQHELKEQIISLVLCSVHTVIRPSRDSLDHLSPTSQK